MFIHKDFLLRSQLSRQLYHDFADKMPIVDYHCHLEPKDIATDYRFTSITELWLGGDHYKWRAMRANGIPEEYITGNGNDKAKFLAWADTVENAIGNPLHHWTHLELKQYFGITDLLTKENAEEIYNQCNQYLQEHKVTAVNLIQQSNVKFIGTTDDILSDLKYHKELKDRYDFTVAPSFRPDPVLSIMQGFGDYIKKCATVAGNDLVTYDSLKQFLIERVHFFHEVGCKSADHGFGELLYDAATKEEIEAIYQKGLQGLPLTRQEIAKWQGRVMVDLGREYAKLGWVMQIHFGAIRSVNTRLFDKLGRDIGCDSILDQGDIAIQLNSLLDALDRTNELPKTILYNLNPSINELVATACGNFQGNDKKIKSKVQFGAGWWFNDQYDGMLAQMQTLSNQGLLMNFVGMLTDSRSFISYPRHEYFRRALCEMIAQKVEAGYYPNDQKLLKKLIQNVCYQNAHEFFELKSEKEAMEK